MLNKVILMGRLTADPELKQTQGGVLVTSFYLATERNYAPKGEQRQADFIPIVAWRQKAEFISRYFAKGHMIAIEGSIQTRKYEDGSGNRRTAFEVVADQVYFAGGNAGKAAQPDSIGALTAEELESFEELEGDMPF